MDEEASLAARYGVSSIPTVIRMENGADVAKSVGYLPKEALLDELGL